MQLYTRETPINVALGVAIGCGAIAAICLVLKALILVGWF